MKKLTEEDKRSIAYFIREKSIESWCDWDTKKELVREEFPHLVKSLEEIEFQQRLIEFELDRMLDKIDED